MAELGRLWIVVMLVLSLVSFVSGWGYTRPSYEGSFDYSGMSSGSGEESSGESGSASGSDSSSWSQEDSGDTSVEKGSSSRESDSDSSSDSSSDSDSDSSENDDFHFDQETPTMVTETDQPDTWYPTRPTVVIDWTEQHDEQSNEDYWDMFEESSSWSDWFMKHVLNSTDLENLFLADSDGQGVAACPVCDCSQQMPAETILQAFEGLQMATSVNQALLYKAISILQHQDESLAQISQNMDVVQKEIEAVDTGPSCPPGFTIVHHGGSECLRLMTSERATWAEAQRTCQHLGPRTHLANLDTPEKREQLSQALAESATRPESLWVGGVRTTSGSDGWYWVSTGRHLATETEMEVYYPEMSKNSNCLLLHPTMPPLLAYLCDAPLYFACQHDLE